MFKFINEPTTVGKTAKVIFYTVLSAAIVGALNGVLDAFKVYEGVFPPVFAVGLTSAVNAAIVAIKSFLDPSVKNI